MKEFPTFLVTLSFGKSSPNQVTVAFTAGLAAQKKGHQAGVMLLIEGVELAVQGEGDALDIGAPFRPVKDLLADYLAAGGKVYVCKACMIHNHVPMEGLLEGVEIIDVNDVVDILDNAKTTLQLN